MPIKNRNQHDPDRFRVHIACPCCESRCLIRASERQTKLSRMSYIRCTNAICGWTGLAVTEILRTVSPPSRFVDGTTAPPLAEDDIYAEAIAAEIEAEKQESLI
ncbi:ogr/Delta-like zinc finger family protein [Neisseria sp. S1]|uniref:ogr/Delta-like zinc finger family protein n=1 Tax=Neisseria sp. S1 TaxID=3318354 RepID=UPI003A87E126